MNRFEELIQLQLKLAEKMIHTSTEIQTLENEMASSSGRNSVLYERKQELLQMEDEFNNLINEVISTFERTSV